MSFEDDIFKRSCVNFNKLKKYGFIEENDSYKFEKEFLNNEFKAIIIINNSFVNGKVIDLQTNDEYINFRTNTNGEFVNKVRNHYLNILLDIKNNCFENQHFIYEQSNRIAKYIYEHFHNSPEFLWNKYPGFGVFRNKYSNKWYGVIMNVDRSILNDGNGEIEIMNLKVDSNKINDLLSMKGYYKAYHMNKKHWISLLLNDTIDDEKIIELINESYNLVDRK